MDIKDFMDDFGELDSGKIKQHYDYIYPFTYFVDELCEAINAHIASLTQETPITVELLERAGFEAEYRDQFTRPGYRKGVFFVSDDLLVLNGRTAFRVQTMEELSTVHKCYTNHPLNWQHDPAAELRKRLEAIGFNYTGASQYLQDIGQLTFMVDIRDGKFSECFICGRRSTIQTIDQLETVVKGMKGE